MNKKVDAAVAAVEAQGTELVAELGIVFRSSGRTATVVLPVDLTDVEIHEFAGWAVLVLPAAIAEAQRKAARTPALWQPGKPT